MELIIELLKVIALGVIEGFSEWLPISSTGHMILADEFLKLNVDTEFKNLFLVVIQLGAILAVVWLYFHKLNPFSPKKTSVQKKETWSIWFKVLAAVTPAAVIGLLFEDAIDQALGSPMIVVAMLILYGVLFIVVENKNKGIKPRVNSFQMFTYQDAMIIGFLQVLALIPGTSRSGVTIVGAIMFGMSRKIAAEFTFFLSIPVMFGVSFLKLIKYGFDFTGIELLLLLVGCVVAFFVSVFTIKFLMSYIKKHDFKVFGYYRIGLGVILFIYFMVKAMV